MMMKNQIVIPELTMIKNTKFNGIEKANKIKILSSFPCIMSFNVIFYIKVI